MVTTERPNEALSHKAGDLSRCWGETNQEGEIERDEVHPTGLGLRVDDGL